MSLRSFWIAVLRWPIRWFTRTETIIDQVDEQHRFSDTVYVMRSDSVADLLIVRRALQRAGYPDPLEPIQVGAQRLPRVMFLPQAAADSSQQAIAEFHQLLSYHHEHSHARLQLLPLAVFWGRIAGQEPRQGRAMTGDIDNPGMWRKFLLVLFSGRNVLLRVSRPVSLRAMADDFGHDLNIAHKLARVARVHFTRLRHAVAGPKLTDREQVIRELLATPALQKAIRDEAKARKQSEAEATKTARKYLREIAANYSATMVRLLDRVMTWIWSRIYNGIEVKGDDRLRQLAQAGHEIIYVPCHRSHMDYLLLSYVIYKSGLVPPHIAAGVNLNFFPVGSLFRRGGAFFIRRSFRGNKLYSAVFREYLCRLFQKGYPVKYFSEGGRSRTGRLLPPKTGMIAMTVQGMLRDQQRPVSLVPVYLGYEHVMEVGTYLKELQGKSKEKESMFQVLKTVKNLRNFGHGFVTFGEPLNLGDALDHMQPDWRDSMTRGAEEPARPKWLTPTVNVLADHIMQRINDAGALNSINLTALALLSSEHRALTRDELVAQLDVYVKLMTEVPYSRFMTVPKQSGEQLWQQAQQVGKFQVKRDSMGEVISIDGPTAVAMTYYRNNIIHMMIVPALVANMILAGAPTDKASIISFVKQLLPMLRAELFMSHSEADIELWVAAILEDLAQQKLIVVAGTDQWQAPGRASRSYFQLQLLARGASETLQRYGIVLELLQQAAPLSRAELEQHSTTLAERLSDLHGISAPEFFDKKVLSTFIATLKEQAYIVVTDAGDFVADERVGTLSDQIDQLLDSAVLQTIRQSVQHLLLERQNQKQDQSAD